MFNTNIINDSEYLDRQIVKNKKRIRNLEMKMH